MAFGVSRICPSLGTIIFPALYCESTAEPLVAMGYKIYWADINFDLTLNLDTLLSIIERENVVGVVICDYFGWVANNIESILNLAKRYGIFVIRDCCHSALSWSPGQVQCDMTVFSFRKTIPIWDGGGVIFNRQNFEDHILGGRSYRRELFREGSRLLEFGAFSIALNLYLILDLIQSHKPAGPIKDRMRHQEILPSTMLANFVNSLKAQELVSQRRRENFLHLKNLLKKLGLDPLCSNVADSDVPQIFPLVMDNAQALTTFLRARGIGAVSWPSYELPRAVQHDPGRFSVAVRQSTNIVGLPIHQDLPYRSLQQISKIIEKWLFESRANK